MNWNFGQLECDYCKASFNCSVGLSNKNTVQVFSFCCYSCSGVLSIEIDPHRSSDYKLINLKRNENFKGSIFDLKTIKLHIDFPAVFTDGFNPFSPYIMANLGLKDGCNIEHFKAITNELNFYSENILKLQSFFNFYKNKKYKELLIVSQILLRDEFDIIIKVDSDYINSLSIFEYVTTRDLDVVFYKSLFGMSTSLNKGDNPDCEVKDISLYLSGMSKGKLCEFRSYLTNNKYLQSAIETSNRIYSNIYSNEEFFRPAIFLSDYSGVECKNGKSPLRLVSEKVEVILGIYKDLVEVISKQYTLVIGLRNIKENDDYNKSTKNKIKIGSRMVVVNNIADFSNVDLGLKIKFMEGCYFYNDFKSVSHKIRNAIAHNNWEYKERSQEVVFYYNKGIVDGPEHARYECKTILEINRDIVNLFRLMHKLNIFHYLFNCFWGCEDWSEQE
ncbi:hypothetical protein WCT65_03530 [Pectobacterium carotovorum]|uniref:hypothetical protein n=1 Tax=Pectobacterium carotovorum TaxID=554 RepID=UPI003018E3E6